MQVGTNAKLQQSHKIITDELIHFLADTYILYVKTQNFHWNVMGPNFPAYHLLFEQQYQELAGAADTIAERIRALGSLAPGSLSEFQKLTSLKESSGKISAQDMIKTLMKDHETISHQAHLAFVKAEKAQDQATMDLLIERMRVHDKAVWVLRSSLG